MLTGQAKTHLMGVVSEAGYALTHPRALKEVVTEGAEPREIILKAFPATHTYGSTGLVLRQVYDAGRCDALLLRGSLRAGNRRSTTLIEKLKDDPDASLAGEVRRQAVGRAGGPLRQGEDLSRSRPGPSLAAPRALEVEAPLNEPDHRGVWGGNERARAPLLTGSFGGVGESRPQLQVLRVGRHAPA